MLVIGGLFLVAVVAFVAGPRVAFRLAGAGPPDRGAYLPWLAVLLFVVSWFLPDPRLGETSTFVRHAVGGGAACALAGLYLACNAGVRSPLLRIGVAYATAACLGVAVELLELLAEHAGGGSFTADSAWDLLANSTGAIVTAVLLEFIFLLPRSHPVTPRW